MTVRIVGAFFVVAACASFGFAMAAGLRRQTVILQQLILALEFMENQLSCRMPSLPELCRSTAESSTGVVRKLFARLSRELENQVSADAVSCMEAALKGFDRLPEGVRQNMMILGTSLGRFHLEGQLSGIDSVIGLCKRDLEGLTVNLDQRLRSIRTLGVCAGIAIAILFM